MKRRAQAARGKDAVRRNDASQPPIPADARPLEDALTALAQQHHRTARGRRPRLADLGTAAIERRLRAAYRRIAADPRRERPSGRAEEWLTDNRHLIEQALAQVRKHLPLAYLRRLPRVASPRPDGTLDTAIRARALADLLIGSGPRPLDLAELESSLEHYQSATVLDIGEIWALPSFLRLAILRDLAEVVEGVPSQSDQDAAVDAAARAERIAGAIVGLRLLDNHDWRRSFERLAQVESILRRDPAGAYANMDFATRNRYRGAIEELARNAGLEQVETAERVLRACLDADPIRPRERHVGHYLIGSGRYRMEQVLGIRPSFRRRLSRGLLRRPGTIYFGLLGLFALPPVLGLGTWLLASASAGVSMLGVLLLITIPLLGLATTLTNGAITRLLAPRALPRMNFEKGIPAEYRVAVVMPVLLAGADDIDRALERIEINFLNNDDKRLIFAILSDFADADAAEVEADATLLKRVRDGIHALNHRHGTGPERGPFLLLHRERRWNPDERLWMGWERKRGKLIEFNRLLSGATDTDYTARIGPDRALLGVRFVITLDADTHLPPGTARRLVGTLAHPLNRAVLDHEHGGISAGYAIVQPRLEVDPDSAAASRFARTMSGDTSIDLYTHAVSDVYHDLFGEGIYTGKGIYDWRAFEHAMEDLIPENTLLSHDLLEGVHGRVALAADTIVLEQFPSNAIAYMRRLHRWVRGDWQLLPWLLPWTRDARGRPRPNRLPAIHRWKMLDNLRRSLQSPAVLALLLLTWTGALPGAIWAWTLAILAMHAAPLVGEALGLASRAVSDPLNLPDCLRQAPATLRRPLRHWLLSLSMLPYESQVVLDAAGRSLYRMLISRRRLLEWTPAAHIHRRLGGSLKPTLLWREMWAAPALAVAATLAGAWGAPAALPVLAPLALLWLLAPAIAGWTARPHGRRVAAISAAARRRLRGLARRTWLFFEQFVGPDDHWLAPDNYQEEPRPALARRTSPTNIGLALSAGLAAHDFGYIDASELIGRVRNCFETLARMERYRGHWLNWYSTRDLRPLEPRYVSTVDSGNLAAALLTLARGMEEIAETPLNWQLLIEGALDSLDMIDETLVQTLIEAGRKPAAGRLSALRELRRDLSEASRDPHGWRAFDRLAALDASRLEAPLLNLIEIEKAAFGAEDLDRLRAWLDALQRQFLAGRRHIETLLPWLRSLAESPTDGLAEAPAPLSSALDALHETFATTPNLVELPHRCDAALAVLEQLDVRLADHDIDPDLAASVRDWSHHFKDRLERCAAHARKQSADLAELTRQSERWALAMDFAFLYDEQRHLFRIGYDIDRGQRDANHYDLLASEARLASLIAIAKGDVPMRHWLHLARPLRRRHGRTVLMSWSATLFEYLMPRLFMISPADSLLDRACRTAIALHRDFGARLGLPWGVSESGYYQLDEHQHYQYRAFGVPGLGFRNDLGDRMVVAPYASAMALAFAPLESIENLERLRRNRALGRYGLYEAIDFGRTGKAAPRRARVVRSYMSHHQGMILVALNNFLNDDPMPRRFHADRRIAGVSTLLHERPPPASFALKSWEQPPPTRALRTEAGPRLWSHPPGELRRGLTLLSNGHYSLLLDAAGGGGSEWDGQALIPWQPDPIGGACGHWFYVKDLDDGLVFSPTLEPGGGDPAHCTAELGPHRAEFQRHERGLSCRMTVAIASRHDIEVRRIGLRNESDRPRRVLLVEFAELALAPPREFARHPAFARLFVESEYLADDAIALYRRRPRGPGEKSLYLAHTVVVAPGVEHRFGWDTDRAALLGRGRRPARPRALDGGIEGFAGGVGTVLDPALGSAVELTLAPYARVEIGYLTGVGRSRDELLTALRSYRSLPRMAWILEQSRMQTGQELRNLDIDPDRGQDMQHLLSAALAPGRGLRASPERLARAERIQSLLWARGISGDWPIVLVLLRDDKDIGTVEPLLKAHTFWCGRGARIDLVLIDEQAGGYLQPGRDRLLETIAALRARTHRKLSGSALVLPGTELRPEERTALYAAAQAIVDTGLGPVATQLSVTPAEPPALPSLNPSRGKDWRALPTPPLERPGNLLFDNGLGGFDPDDGDYLLHLSADRQPPAPWSNLLANPDFGGLIDDSGNQCTWADNSGEWRLTPWHNDPVRDRGGEALYLRDEETGAVWSPTPRPIPGDGDYLIRHGLGYSEFRHHGHGLSQTLTVHVDPEAPVKLSRLTLRNHWPWTRRITVTCYVEWVLGVVRADNAPFLHVDYATETRALLARNSFAREHAESLAFLTASLSPHGISADREEFLGRGGDLEAPAALNRIGLSGRVRPGDDPCAAYQVHLDIPPDAERTVHFVLGQGRDRAQALTLAARYRHHAEALDSLGRAREHWRNLLDAVQVRTPEPAMDLLLNRWLPYQTLACRMWGRSGRYQSSGAYGFRDQLQDALALTWAAPHLTRAHLLRAAARQFQDGDVLHWWHEAPLRGVRSRCSDDLLWLPYAVAHHLRRTGDSAILREPVEYLTGAPLQRDETEHYAEFRPSGERGSLYEHCCRAIDRASAVGPHGLPTIGSGDWNDGLNRVSTSGRGESVWLAWFLARVCDDFAPICAGEGDEALAEHYQRLSGVLRKNIDDTAWDGQWYRRAYYDDGTAIGSAAEDECRIDLIAQAWAALATEPPGERARQAMDSAWRHLVREEERLVLLLTPPFDRTTHDPGYIKAYPPGIRENGGQYTHAATWAVWAMAALGDGDRAMRLFRLLNPILRTDSPEGVARYRVEPYVLAGDIYSVAPHSGRGGWTWYTGASGWLYRIALENLLGLRQRGDRLEIAPCLPSDWPGYGVSLRRGAARYRIEVERDLQLDTDIALEFDGSALDGRIVPFLDDGQNHRVLVRLGARVH